MKRKNIAYLILALLWLTAGLLAEQKKDKDDQLNTRSVQGVVTDNEGKPVAGAIVQLKNTKTLQVRSFVTKEDGSYYFHGLSPNVDYELKAESGNASASTKTLSSFDSRKTAIINFKLETKK